MMRPMYQVRTPSRSEFVAIRDQNYHVRLWGRPAVERAPLVLLHGWMDVAASWQFMVDAFEQRDDERLVIAPDWRGFGLTSGPPVDSYWMPDYLADLDFLLDHYAADARIDLVGHSMGGNVALSYAGVRRERVARLVNLEGFGLPATRAAQAPERYARWIDEIRQLRRGALALNDYGSADDVARRLKRTNPRLSDDKAEWLARHWARQDADGRWRILGDAAHKVISANLYRADETVALLARIAAPVLSVRAARSSPEQWWQGQYTLAEFEERMRAVPRLDTALIEGAGHMLHHDQPEALARLIEDFLARPA